MKRRNYVALVLYLIRRRKERLAAKLAIPETATSVDGDLLTVDGAYVTIK